MISIYRNVEEEIKNDKLIIPKSLIECPQIKSCSKLLIIYLLANADSKHFTWSLFESRTGVKRAEREKAMKELLDKEIIIIRGEEQPNGFTLIKEIILNYSNLLNHMNSALKTIPRRKPSKSGRRNKPVLESDIDSELETDIEEVDASVENEH